MKQIIKEFYDPDEIEIDDKWYDFESDNAYPFLVNTQLNDGKLLIGGEGDTHNDLLSLEVNGELFNPADRSDADYIRRTLRKHDTIEGRIWILKDGELGEMQAIISTWDGIKDKNIFLEVCKHFNVNPNKTLYGYGNETELVEEDDLDSLDDFVDNDLVPTTTTDIQNTSEVLDKIEKNKIKHMLPPEEKWRATADFRDTVAHKNAEKLKGMPMAKYHSLIYQEEKQYHPEAEDGDKYQIGLDGSGSALDYGHVIKEGRGKIDFDEVDEIRFTTDCDVDGMHEEVAEQLKETFESYDLYYDEDGENKGHYVAFDEEHNPIKIFDEQEYKSLEEQYIKENCEFDISFYDRDYQYLGGTIESLENLEDYYSFEGIPDEYIDLILEEFKQDPDYFDGEYRIDEIKFHLYTDDDDIYAAAKKLYPIYDEYFEGARGFILQDGTIIATEAEHNEITWLKGVESKFQFIEMGNIRIMPNSIDIGQEPTWSQREVLKDLIRCYSDSDLYMDISDKGNNACGCHYIQPYYQRVLADIDRYYEEGMKPLGESRKIKKIYINEDALGLLKNDKNFFSVPMIDYNGEQYFDDDEDAVPFAVLYNKKILYGKKGTYHHANENINSANLKDIELYGRLFLAEDGHNIIIIGIGSGNHKSWLEPNVIVSVVNEVTKHLHLDPNSVYYYVDRYDNAPGSLTKLVPEADDSLTKRYEELSKRRGDELEVKWRAEKYQESKESKPILKETHQSILYHYVFHPNYEIINSILRQGLKVNTGELSPIDTQINQKNGNKENKYISFTRVSGGMDASANTVKLTIDASALLQRGDISFKPVDFMHEWDKTISPTTQKADGIHYDDMSEKEERLWKINDRLHDGDFLSNPSNYILRVDLPDKPWAYDIYHIFRDKPEWEGKIYISEMKDKKYKFGNYHKKKEVTENIDMEVAPDEVDTSSFEVQDELQPEIWRDNQLNPQIRLKLLDIADDFFNTLDLSWIKPKDIILTGSICNFNWSQYSDIDLHVVIDFNEVSERTDFVQTFCDAKKNEWNDQHKDLEIFGFPVELYVQDINALDISSGIYSLNKNAWIQEPNPNEMTDIDNIDSMKLKIGASSIMTLIDNMEEEFNSTEDKHQLEVLNDKIEHLSKKIKELRQSGLENNGEMSTPNLIYKVLRRTEYLQKMWDLMSKIYDKVNSIE